MAVRYAVATGNWSSTSTWDGGTLPTSADDVYANGFTVTIDQDVTVLSIRTRSTTGVVAGGTFIINSAINITVTGSGIIGGTGSCITFNAISGITSNITTTNLTAPDTNTSQTINHIGSGTLTINCTSFVGSGAGSSRNVIVFNSNGILNYSGGAISGVFSTTTFIISGTGTLNIIANIFGGSNTAGLNITGTATVNITGNITGGSNSGQGISISAGSTLNITGNISGNTGAGAGVGINNTSGNARVFVTGNVTGFDNTGINSVGYTNIIGAIRSNNSYGLSSTSTSAINVCSGPFVCTTYGFMPILCVRMHLIPSANSYFEFRDETTNGALSPGAIAPATRLVSPATAIDAPAQSNVRFGVTYSQGSLTGTLRMPTPQQVAYGVAVDNTTGSAVLTPDAVWNYLSAQLTDTGSIGARLKNVATPQTVGSQLASFFK